MTDGVTSDTYRELSNNGVSEHNNRMIAKLRANNGKLPDVPDSEMLVMILTITGAKSGVRRETPLGYFEHEDRLYFAGSNGGQEAPPAWIRNLRANPFVTAEVAGTAHDSVVRELLGPERDEIFTALVAKHAFFGEYQSRLQRTIPVFELI
ncbi:nitroreductase family deazaflavin-dependent oxidoreductase [Mycobacterium sp. CBMA293]|uniref:nitroreductase/quinone reductase family protein n=1 Tax=unclassified Mycolicibacterium TaxID=2636767 RepID=UPI0012DBDCFC|nr:MULTISPECIES: nitroreductase/quinone reductase family protein [unclassified Mycolicibacterium]MUL46635.1 nitroreductase family deazaflavin-dependent oxidoreductase [Mycolicibacterium sp. CBMA 360]MUL59064.1 nitroreductase family deazaflavin-dependent oxidoreductase [Mycolicibacterium sp. CBMA 335]MUL69458.1 nitroreductase family deazaflavin-dependent oxidoreductase [Mycolicibacterium sp. CBMA 311]MUL94422.1 nitroreductase family deazaflavin-dependent oxidoreductase [Mycolicibacterium sp. CBM